MSLTLHVPELSELGFRQRLLSDPETMSYNAGCDLGFPGYHNDTGCIDFPRGGLGRLVRPLGGS